MEGIGDFLQLFGMMADPERKVMRLGTIMIHPPFGFRF